MILSRFHTPPTCLKSLPLCFLSKNREKNVVCLCPLKCVHIVFNGSSRSSDANHSLGDQDAVLDEEQHTYVGVVVEPQHSHSVHICKRKIFFSGKILVENKKRRGAHHASRRDAQCRRSKTGATNRVRTYRQDFGRKPDRHEVAFFRVKVRRGMHSLSLW